MDQSGISLLARLQLPLSSRLHPSSCCPDKDLVVVFSRLGGKDRMSLWKMQGSKKWEVDVDVGLPAKEEVIDLAWSPDCQTIVLIHDPPRISCHSVQDGREERHIPIAKGFSRDNQLCAIWWFVEGKKPPTSAIPDMFRRRDIITGSTHSVLKMLPLLDALKDDVQSPGAHDLFGFQGIPKPSTSSKMPSSIKQWPSLPPDPITASIQPPKRPDDIQEEDLDDVDDINVNSILAVADSSGSIQCFLDGSYPLGTVTVELGSITVSLLKCSGSSKLLAFQDQTRGDVHSTSLLPAEVDLTLLRTRIPRDVARISSTVSQLLWFLLRVMDDIRDLWIGSDTQTGAREPGVRWLSRLRDLQPTTEDAMTWAKLDLIQLLTTERSTEAISNFIGAGEQMSERGLLKWDNAVTSALCRLRDESQQRIAPACQRVHLALEEVLAWSQLPGLYGLCQLDEAEIHRCLAMVRQAIVTACWLTSVARRELSRFKEFMKWLRYEINNAAPTGDHVLHPRHDVLEVQSYLSNGLIDSSIDGLFVGSPPASQSLGQSTAGAAQRSLSEAMDRAQRALRDPAETSLQRPVRYHSLGSADRNLHALLHNLTEKCGAIFLHASSATARSASCVRPSSRRSEPTHGSLIVRERTIANSNGDEAVQYLAAYIPGTGNRTRLGMFRLRYDQDSVTRPALASAVFDCVLLRGGTGGSNSANVQLLGVEFFDDDCLVVVARIIGPEEQTVVALVDYSSLEYTMIHEGESLADFSREGIAWETMERWRAGELPSLEMTAKRSYVLGANPSEHISLSVNGRQGRRVACVLDLEGSVLEVLDMEADSGDSEEDEA